jgi:hypothetical protein
MRSFDVRRHLVTGEASWGSEILMRPATVGTAASSDSILDRTVTVVMRRDCSHGVAAVAAVKALATTLGLPIRIEEIHVETDEDARVQRCLGSPTIRVNGQDVEPDARERTGFGGT